jgi:hypothetical protein
MSAHDRLSQIVDDARVRTSPWDPSRSTRVLESALARRAASARRHSMLRRGIAAGAGVMMLAFGVHALALPTSVTTSQTPTASQAAANGEAAPCPKDCELATRALNDGGYGTD